eukprot:5164608-Pyramimonas_sp.AAC.1
MILEDQDPSRHNAVVSYLIRTNAGQNYSNNKSTPPWVKGDREHRMPLLRQRAALREQGLAPDTEELKSIPQKLSTSRGGKCAVAAR